MARAQDQEDDSQDPECSADAVTLPVYLGREVTTEAGRHGRIVQHDPDDLNLEFKVEFLDAQFPSADWFREDKLWPITPCEHQMIRNEPSAP